MKNEIVKKFKEDNFTRGSAFLKIKYSNPKNLIVQHLPVKERGKCETNRKRNGYIIDTLTSVDIQQIVKTGGKVIEINEGVIYRKNFRVSPFKTVIDKLFELIQKYKDENNDILQLLVKLFMKSLYGEQIRKNITGSYFIIKICQFYNRNSTLTYTKLKTKPIGMCIDIPMVNSKTIGSPFH